MLSDIWGSNMRYFEKLNIRVSLLIVVVLLITSYETPTEDNRNQNKLVKTSSNTNSQNLANNLQSDFLSQDYKDNKNKITRLIEERNMMSLVDTLAELEVKFTTKSEIYGYLMADICSALNSYNFNDTKQYLNARNCTKKILYQADKIPVRLERDLIDNLRGNEEYRMNLLPESEWAKDRQERIGFLLHLWQRVQNNIDRNFDINDDKNRPIGNVPVPTPNYVPGMRPEDIKEPDVRAKYEKAIEENNKKAKRFNLQVELQRIDKNLLKFVEDFLIQMYSVLPIDITELDKNLSAFGIKGDKAEAIKKVIQNQ